MFAFLCSSFVVLSAAKHGAPASWYGVKDVAEGHCHMTQAYPPPANRSLETFVIDLDKPAADRWAEPTAKYKAIIADVISLTIGAEFMLPFRRLVDEAGVDSLLARLPEDWGDEISAIASQLDMPTDEVFLYNLAYSLMGFCTSIVAQNDDGTIYHGRNLDFGLWPAFNFSDWQWTLTTELKQISFIANFTKNGSLLYQTATYGGFIGMHTGVKAGIMTLTLDLRFDDNIDKYLAQWITTPSDNNQLLVMTTRYVMENLHSFSSAVEYLKGVPLVCPAYVIIGGINPGEGAVLTYGPNSTLFDDWGYPNGFQLPSNNTQQKPFYVLETNYDHWKQPPWYDDRRYPAEDCMDEIGSKNIDFGGLYNVLNGMPNRNRLTTFTAVMHGAVGHLEAYIQYCNEPECSPW